MFANNHHQHTTELGKTSHVLSFPKLSSFQNLQKHKTTQNTNVEHTPFQASTIIPSPLPSIIISNFLSKTTMITITSHLFQLEANRASNNPKMAPYILKKPWPLFPCHNTFCCHPKEETKKIIDLISSSNISKAKKIVAICKPNLVTLQTRNYTTPLYMPMIDR